MEHYNKTLTQLQDEITQLTSDKRGTKTELYSDVQRTIRKNTPIAKVDVDWETDGKKFWVRLHTNTPEQRSHPILFMVEVTCEESNIRTAGNIRPRGYYANTKIYQIKSIEFTPVQGMTKESTIAEIIAYMEGITESYRNQRVLERQRKINEIHQLLKDGDLKGLLNAYEKLDYNTKEYLRTIGN